MAIGLSVKFDFGGADTAPGTSVDVDSYGPPCLVFKNADNATIDTNNKMKVPAAGAGPYYSYWKHIYLYCDDPDGYTISNLRLYSDGASGYGTGVDLYVGLQFPTKNSGSDAGYEVASGSATTGDELVANHGGITTSASLFTYTVASPLTVSVSEAGNVIDLAAETSNYFLLQMKILNTASAGTLSNETFYVAYDYA